MNLYITNITDQWNLLGYGMTHLEMWPIITATGK